MTREDFINNVYLGVKRNLPTLDKKSHFIKETASKLYDQLVDTIDVYNIYNVNILDFKNIRDKDDAYDVYGYNVTIQFRNGLIIKIYDVNTIFDKLGGE